MTTILQGLAARGGLAVGGQALPRHVITHARCTPQGAQLAACAATRGASGLNIHKEGLRAGPVLHAAQSGWVASYVVCCRCMLQ